MYYNSNIKLIIITTKTNKSKMIITINFNLTTQELFLVNQHYVKKGTIKKLIDDCFLFLLHIYKNINQQKGIIMTLKKARKLIINLTKRNNKYKKTCCVTTNKRTTTKMN